MDDSVGPFAIRCNADLTHAIVYSGLDLTCFDSLVRCSGGGTSITFATRNESMARRQ